MDGQVDGERSIMTTTSFMSSIDWDAQDGRFSGVSCIRDLVGRGYTACRQMLEWRRFDSGQECVIRRDVSPSFREGFL